MSDEYYEPYQIWTKDKDDKSNPLPLWRAQTRWLLSNLPILQAGKWPGKPTSYTEPGGGRHVKAKAAFTNPVEWAAEIERRCEMCHVDGLITIAALAFDWNEQSLARHARCDVYTVRKIQGAVIKYISRPKLKGAYWRKNQAV